VELTRPGAPWTEHAGTGPVGVRRRPARKARRYRQPRTAVCPPRLPAWSARDPPGV